MRHQALVEPVVAAELGEVVGERLAVGEQAPKARQAGVARIARAVDDARLGQHEVDEADPAVVVGHLVGDAARRRRTGADGGDVCDAELAPALGAGLANAVEERRRRARPAARHAGGEPADLGQLAGAVHLAVAGENLLDERRSRARHADDEDG